MDRPVPRYLRGLAAAGNSACSTGSNYVDLNVYVSPCGLRIGSRLVSTVHQDSGDIALKSRYLHIEANLKKVLADGAAQATSASIAASAKANLHFDGRNSHRTQEARRPTGREKLLRI